MSTEAIYQKYTQAVSQITGDGAWVDWGVMRLALRLAIADAYDAAPVVATDLAAIVASRDKALQSALDQIDQLRQQRNTQPDQRKHELLAAQIERLNDWLADNATDQYFADNDTATAVIVVLDSQRQQIDGQLQQLAQMDADNADLTRRLRLSETHLAAHKGRIMEAQQEIDRLTHQNVIAVDTVNSLLEPATIHTNGDTPARPAPTDWHVFLDEEANDWRISLDAGRRRFGSIPKHARLRLIQAILRGTQIDIGNTAAMPTMADYDAVRPAWAPTSSGVTKTFGCSWSDVLDLTMVAP